MQKLNRPNDTCFYVLDTQIAHLFIFLKRKIFPILQELKTLNGLLGLLKLFNQTFL